MDLCGQQPGSLPSGAALRSSLAGLNALCPNRPMGWRHPVALATERTGAGPDTGAGLGRGLYKRAAGARRGVGSVAAGRAGRRPRGRSRGERASGGAEDPIHSLGRPMGRSRVNAF